MVIVRDDNWATEPSPFNALLDLRDLQRGIRIATGLNNPFNSSTATFIGQQRSVGDLSIAVDSSNSATVYVCWGDLQAAGTYTLHVVKSTDSGVTWSGDIRAVTNATNPALAINHVGRLGFLYQQVTGAAPVSAGRPASS